MRSEHRAPLVASILVVLTCAAVLVHTARAEALGGVVWRLPRVVAASVVEPFHSHEGTAPHRSGALSAPVGVAATGQPRTPHTFVAPVARVRHLAPVAHVAQPAATSPTAPPTAPTTAPPTVAAAPPVQPVSPAQPAHPSHGPGLALGHDARPHGQHGHQSHSQADPSVARPVVELVETPAGQAGRCAAGVSARLAGARCSTTVEVGELVRGTVRATVGAHGVGHSRG